MCSHISLGTSCRKFWLNSWNNTFGIWCSREIIQKTFLWLINCSHSVPDELLFDKWKRRTRNYYDHFYFAMTSFEKHFFYHSLACNQNEDEKAINRRVSNQNSSIVMIKKKFLQEMDHKSFNSTQRNSLWIGAFRMGEVSIKTIIRKKLRLQLCRLKLFLICILCINERSFFWFFVKWTSF